MDVGLTARGRIAEVDKGEFISAQAFLQINTAAAEGLYDAVRRVGEFSGQETVWDLYCGAGSIALSLAPHVRQVVSGGRVVKSGYRNPFVDPIALQAERLLAEGALTGSELEALEAAVRERRSRGAEERRSGGVGERRSREAPCLSC